MRFCPKCDSDSEVINSRIRRGNNTLRRRKCTSCGERWSTVELSLAQADQFDRIAKQLRSNLTPSPEGTP